MRAGCGRTSCNPGGGGVCSGGGEPGVLTLGKHLGVLAEVQEHREVLVKGVLMAGHEAVGEHLGAAEEDQEELKNEKNTYFLKKLMKKKCLSKLIKYYVNQLCINECKYLKICVLLPGIK